MHCVQYWIVTRGSGLEEEYGTATGPDEAAPALDAETGPLSDAAAVAALPCAIQKRPR